MKSISRIAILSLTFLAFAVSAFAQSPREQFQAAVVAYQKAPSDSNAVKVIQLYNRLAPSPAVPEEAREPFVMGGTVLKRAGNPTEAFKAVDLFTQSLNVAPWFADAYYNRALARETAGQFELAIADLKVYLEFKITEAERRQVQDKIYSLKADAQLASAKKAEQDKIARAEELKRQAEQAKRDVITQIKNAVGNRQYRSSTLSLGSEVKNFFDGISHRELFGGGTFYKVGSHDVFWKFFDERVEVWSTYDDGYQSAEVIGESWGPQVTDMRWFMVRGQDEKGDQIWAYFDLQNDKLYASSPMSMGNIGHGARPLSSDKFDPNVRYAYVLISPR